MGRNHTPDDDACSFEPTGCWGITGSESLYLYMCATRQNHIYHAQNRRKERCRMWICFPGVRRHGQVGIHTLPFWYKNFAVCRAKFHSHHKIMP
jgi:hypothetical protein